MSMGFVPQGFGGLAQQTNRFRPQRPLTGLRPAGRSGMRQNPQQQLQPMPGAIRAQPTPNQFAGGLGIAPQISPGLQAPMVQQPMNPFVAAELERRRRAQQLQQAMLLQQMMGSGQFGGFGGLR